MKKCLISGSYDPITNGHIEIIKKACEMCDIVIVGVFNNEEKQYLFDIETRLKLCKLACENLSKVKVISDSGMVCDFCKTNQIDLIVRGFRNSVDYDYETQMAKFNFRNCGVLTYLLPATEVFNNVSSSKVREIIFKNFDNNKNSIKEFCKNDKINCNSSEVQIENYEINDLLPKKVWEEIRRIKNA